MTCSTASKSGKFAWSGVGIGEGTTLKGIIFRLSNFFFNKGLEHESGFFIATPRMLCSGGVAACQVMVCVLLAVLSVALNTATPPHNI